MCFGSKSEAARREGGEVRQRAGVRVALRPLGQLRFADAPRSKGSRPMLAKSVGHALWRRSWLPPPVQRRADDGTAPRPKPKDQTMIAGPRLCPIWVGTVQGS
eukprot:202870-Pyramimonas_sp.AAC.1